MKTQTIRLLDVFLIGPLMVWGGCVGAKKHPTAGRALAAFGVATVLYNGNNYLKVRESEQEV
jgi:hypothetical protein